MAVITLSEVKTYLGITVTTYDALITLLIPEVEQDIKDLCNRTFKNSLGADDWPSNIKSIAAKMVGYKMAALKQVDSAGFKSESQGDWSYTRADSQGGYSQEIIAELSKLRFTRVHSGSKMTGANDRRGLSTEELARDVVLDGVEGIPIEE